MLVLYNPYSNFYTVTIKIQHKMDFNKFLKALFGDKSSKDMKLIQPLVEKVKNVSPEIEKLSNDDLRAKTKELIGNIQDRVKEQKAKINVLKIKIEDTDIDER